MTIANRPAAGWAPVALLLSVALAASPPVRAAAAADWGVEQLMQALAAVKSSKARFVERKHMAILNAPLESSGTLIYIAPARLEKHTLAPRPESLVLDGEDITIASAEPSQRRMLNLQDYPLIRAFVESIRSTLAGDLPTLTRFYEVELVGSERKWRLTLKPSEPEMQEVVREIRISGESGSISAIETVETNGDRSVMTITGTDP
ncbi:MAG TPA: outer membrane lipoprotein carrier protein LolA [Burkholderiales bacterium]|nr:outer membrane lipoprotein carrier protein LolA [Burkholderiales bacterium]